ncbi:hypothetical protein K6H09_004558 [Candida tropicalis]
MSAFLLLHDQACSRYTSEKSISNKKSSISYAPSAISVASSSRSIPLSYSSSFTRGKEKRKKKVFDISTNSYIDYIYPAFKVSLLVYNESLKIIKSSPYAKFNENLNKQHIFDLKSLEMLRYTYFEDLNYNSVASFRLNQRNVNGDYNLQYMNKIACLTESAEKSLPRLPLDEKEAKEDEEAIPDFNDKQNIKSILQSDQFWNNIFQEMKFESLQSPLDYIEYLPSLKQLKNFYNEILEYFLFNIHTLKPNTEEITDSEETIHLQRLYYVYFTEFNYHYFRIMKLEHDKLFKSCSDINLRYVVYEKLLDVISSNIKAMSGNKQNDALATWEKFLEFIAYDLLSQDFDKLQEKDTNHLQLNRTTTNTNTSVSDYQYKPPRKMSISSRSSNQSFFSMGKATRNGSICDSEGSQMSSPIYEEPTTPVETICPTESQQLSYHDVRIKPKKQSIFKRLLGGIKSST